MKSELELTLLAKYLAEECDNNEKQLVSDWLSKSSKNRLTMKEFEKIWEASERSDFSEDVFDSNLEWVVLQHRIEDESKNFNTRDVNRSTWLSLYDPVLPTLSKIAALFLVAALVGLFFIDRFYVEEVPSNKPVLNEISMDKGYRGGVTLSDGTKVYLNSDSKIIIPNVFKSDKREVFLEGEAFFEVAKN